MPPENTPPAASLPHRSTRQRVLRWTLGTIGAVVAALALFIVVLVNWDWNRAKPWVNDKVSMLRANFPGESLQAVAKHLADQHNPVAYVKSLDFAPEYVSCEYHTAYSNPGFIAKLQAMGVKVALWTVDTEDAVRSLLPLGPDCLVTNRPDRVREWVEENQ